MALDVSVPCGSCDNNIRFGQNMCPSCRAPVSRDLRRALEQRLEGSSADFRAMRNRIRFVSVLLLVSGLMSLVLGGFTYLASPETHDPLLVLGERAAFAFNAVTGVVLTVMSRLVEQHPQKTIVAVFIGWVLVQVGMAAFFPLGLFVGIPGKILTVVILAVGFASARSAEKLCKDLATQASAQH